MNHSFIGVRMLYWVIYDISENNIRNKVASSCKNYGLERVQKSAFIGDVTKNKIEMLALEIKEVLAGSHDCVFIFPTCKNCYDEKIIEGAFDEEKIRKKDFLVISR